MSPSASDNDGLLEIKDATAADAGNYRCTATNSADSIVVTAYIVVLGKNSDKCFSNAIASIHPGVW